MKKMGKGTFKFRQGLFLLTVLWVVFIHACFGGNTALSPLRIGISSWPGFDIALYAQQAGLFEKRGLKVDFVRFENQQDSARAVLRGALDGAFSSLWDIMQVDPGNEKPVFIMTTNISSGSDGIVTRSDIKSVKDLRGKKIGAKLGTINHLILLEALNLHQMNPSDVTIEDVSNETGIQMMEKGLLDGTVSWEPLMSETAKALKGNIIFTTQEVDSLVIDGLMSRSSFVKSNEKVLKQFILAWFDLMQAVETKPAEVYEGVSQQLGQTPESFANDYAGLKKGDISLNQKMFQPGGRLQTAAPEMVKLLREDPQHGRIVREDVEIATAPVMAAIQEWKP